MGLSDVTRKQAFLTHLAVSLGIFFIISYLIVFHWFPDYYFFLDGGLHGIATIFFVDVVLGPGLTLLVFKPEKSLRMLRFDMAVILLMQLSALSWGLNSVYTERAGSTVFYLGKFVCIKKIDTTDMNMTAIEAGPSGKQALSFLQRPDTLEDYHGFVREAFENQSAEIYYYGEKIVPLDERVVKRASNYQLNLPDLETENKDAADSVQAYIDNHGADMEHVNLIPLACRYGAGIAVYDTRELRITDLIKVKTELRPELRAEAQGGFLPGKQPLGAGDESKF